MDMQLYWMKDKLNKKYFLSYWKPGSQTMGGYFTKHNPPYHHKENCATYLNMENSLLKINHTVVKG